MSAAIAMAEAEVEKARMKWVDGVEVVVEQVKLLGGGESWRIRRRRRRGWRREGGGAVRLVSPVSASPLGE